MSTLDAEYFAELTCRELFAMLVDNGITIESACSFSAHGAPVARISIARNSDRLSTTAADFEAALWAVLELAVEHGWLEVQS